MTPVVVRLPLAYFVGWLATGRRGLSSEAIVGHLTGTPMGAHHPHDPSDFHRCQMLLAAYPLAAMNLSQMRTVSPEWDRLVDAWEGIEAAMEKAENGRAPEAYDLIQACIHPERAS